MELTMELTDDNIIEYVEMYIYGNLPDYPIENWDVSKVTNMKDLFYGADFNADISRWDVSNVTNMQEMFHGCANFNRDISGWNVSNVTNMQEMFASCEMFNCDLKSWNVRKVNNRQDIFFDCGLERKNQPLFEIYSLNRELRTLKGREIAMSITTHGNLISKRNRNTYHMQIYKMNEVSIGYCAISNSVRRLKIRDQFSESFMTKKMFKNPITIKANNPQYSSEIVERLSRPVMRSPDESYKNTTNIEYLKQQVQKQEWVHKMGKLTYTDKLFMFDEISREIFLTFFSGFKYFINTMTLGYDMYDLIYILYFFKLYINSQILIYNQICKDL
jgi:surface protein